MSTTPDPNRCPLCGVALSRSANREAHARSQLCASTRRVHLLHAEGFVLGPEDRTVNFLLVAAMPTAGRWEETSLGPQEPFPFGKGPYAQRWWPAWAVEVCGALAMAKLRKPARYPEALRRLVDGAEELREAALTTLRTAGVEALDAFLFAPPSALRSEVPHA